MSESDNTAATATAASGYPDTAEAASFGIADLVFVLQVFEACAQRGAFRAEEMTNVGAVYDRLRVFLVANNAMPQPVTAPDNSAPAEDTTGDSQ
jgi:hypothetical protein